MELGRGSIARLWIIPTKEWENRMHYQQPATAILLVGSRIGLVALWCVWCPALKSLSIIFLFKVNTLNIMIRGCTISRSVQSCKSICDEVYIIFIQGWLAMKGKIMIRQNRKLQHQERQQPT